MLFDPRKSSQKTAASDGASDSGGSFAKGLALKIKTSTGAEILTITPAMAVEMLRYNNRNRPLSPSSLKKYTAAMAGGRWKFTGEPVIFSRERLIDGQTRLTACIKANVSIQCLVMFGAPDDAFAFIDVGKARTAGDIFAIHEVKNNNLMAAAIQWIVGYENDNMGAAAKGSLEKDHAALYEAYVLHPRLQESAWVGRLFAQRHLASPSTMIALHYLCAQKHRGASDEFFRKVGEGLGFSGKKDPAYKLHNRLIDNATSQEKQPRKAIAAMTIKAWNAMRDARDVGVLRYQVDEPFPRIR